MHCLIDLLSPYDQLLVFEQEFIKNNFCQILLWQLTTMNNFTSKNSLLSTLSNLIFKNLTRKNLKNSSPEVKYWFVEIVEIMQAGEIIPVTNVTWSCIKKIAKHVLLIANAIHLIKLCGWQKNLLQLMHRIF